MLNKLFVRIRDAWRVLTAQEYFIVVANEDCSKYTPGVYPKIGPIRYKYSSNTTRSLFYTYVKDYVNTITKD